MIVVGTVCEHSGTRVHVMGSDGACDYCSKDLILVAIDDVPTTDAGELRQLLLDWIDRSLSVISEFGSSTSDWPALIEDAQRRARILGIDWTPNELPGYVKELLAIQEEDRS